MLLSRSVDGGEHWTAPKRFGEGAPAAQERAVVIRASPQIPSFAVDSAGTLYGVWQDSRFSQGRRNDILFVRSTDGGAHLSPPRRIEPSGPAGGLIPTIAAAGDGGLAVLYLALRSESSSMEVRYRLAVSADGGRHFTGHAVGRPFPVAHAPRLTGSPLVPGGYFLGDYMGVASAGDGSFGLLFVLASGDEADRTDVFYRRVS
jgi:hypothetical protein